jgi:hypothetical protein
MIELSDLIRDLRSELQKARASGAGEPLRFEVGPVELDLTVAVTREGGGGAKVRFWVVELGGDAKVSRESTQHVKLTLKPKDAATGRTPDIAGQQAQQEED